MLRTNKTSHFIVFYIVMLIAILSSCVNKSANDTSPREFIALAKQQPDTNAISTKHLKYTSMVQSIFEDSKGNFWFGTDREGVCRYDGKSFTYYSKKDGLSDNQIRNIQEDQNGHIWFETGNGICSFDGEKIINQTKDGLLISIRNSKGKWQKTPLDLWFGNGDQEGGIFRYDNKGLEYLKFPVLDRNHHSYSIPGPVTGTSYDHDNLWIASYSGVLGYDGQSFIFINDRNIDYHIRSILQDSKGNVWMGNNGIGVLCYNGDTTINVSKKYGLSDRDRYRRGIISSKGMLNHVFTIAEDRQGNIWFGDRDSGAWCYDGNSFKNYTKEDGLTSMFVRVIYSDKKGRLWVGMTNGGICLFNGKSFDRMF